MIKHPDRTTILWVMIYTAAVITLILFASLRSWGTPVAQEPDYQAVIEQILHLETGTKHIPCNYSDTCDEVGIAQFRPSTWEWMQKKSGMVWLDIDSPTDQVHMLEWALRNNLGSHWATHKRAQERAVTQKYLGGKNGTK